MAWEGGQITLIVTVCVVCVFVLSVCMMSVTFINILPISIFLLFKVLLTFLNHFVFQLDQIGGWEGRAPSM